MTRVGADELKMGDSARVSRKCPMYAMAKASVAMFSRYLRQRAKPLPSTCKPDDPDRRAASCLFAIGLRSGKPFAQVWFAAQ